MTKAERLQMEAEAIKKAEKLQQEQDERDYDELMKTGFSVENCPVCGTSFVELACEDAQIASKVEDSASVPYYMTCSACGLRGTQANEIWKAIRNWNKMVLEHDKKDAEAEKRRT